MGTRPFISREQGNKCHFFQGNRGTSSQIWGTGEHKILCANDIKYCYKEPFLEETQDGMVLVHVWMFGVFRGVSTDPIQAVPRLTETKPKYRNETEIPERNIKIIGKHIQVYRCDVDLPKRPLNNNNNLLE